MDFSESTKVVYNRIQKLEPENVSKIVGYLLLQDHGEREMIRLAFSPDNIIQSLINKAKSDLGLSSKPGVHVQVSPTQVKQTAKSELPLPYNPFSPSSSHSFSSSATLQALNTLWDPQVIPEPQSVHNLGFVPAPFTHSTADDCRLHNHLQFLSLVDQLKSINSAGLDVSGNYFVTEAAWGQRTSPRSPSLPEFPVSVCHYFRKGFCKHGSNCRYFHGNPIPESLSYLLDNSNSCEFVKDDHVFSPGSLEKLEMELTELLKSRRGLPVSIASLPMLYYEKYGRILQAEGYLTESQRHGRSGYSLTKLLARLQNRIRLIDRHSLPHGQHSVVLAEDLPKYMDYSGERTEHGAIVASSHQIYLTFPAESTFTEQDVSHYFHKYGPVQDVRIPCQQKRMFGFVTFVFAETVKQILAKGNPHFVCGARVLVKPYREKSKHVDRRYPEKLHHPVHYNLHFMDSEFDFSSMPRLCDNSWSLQKRLMEEHEQAIELESGHLSELQLAAKTLNNHGYLGFPMNERKHLEAYAGQEEPPSAEQFTYILDVLNGASTSEQEVGRINTSYSDQESTQALNLPDSPFASPMASSIPTVI